MRRVTSPGGGGGGGGGVPTGRQVATTDGLQGGGDLSADRTLSLTDTGVTADTYTYSTVTVDAKGRITSASSGSPPVAPPSPGASTQPVGTSGAAGSSADYSRSDHVHDVGEDTLRDVAAELTAELAVAGQGLSNVGYAQLARYTGGTDPSGGPVRISNKGVVMANANSWPVLCMQTSPQRPSVLQQGISDRRFALWSAAGNATTVDLTGGALNAATGTATARTVATTNTITMMRRLGYLSATTAGASCGTRHGVNQWAPLTSPTYGGGLLYVARFGVAQIQANMRWFVGLTSSAAVIGNVNPSTLLNIVGFGIDSGQTTVRRLTNDGTGAATATDLGANYPATTANVCYQVTLACLPGSTSWACSIERFNDGNLFTSETFVTTDVPASGTLISPQIWMNNGTTAAAVAIDVAHWYLETDL